MLNKKMSDFKMQETLMRVTCFFLLVTKLLSYKCWIAYRTFPTVAVSELFDNVPSFIHLLLYVIAILCFTLFIFKSKNKILVIALIAEIGSCLLDLLRWQPYEYLYLFIIAFYLIFNNKPQQFFVVLRLLLISTYFFSGLQKIGGAFLYSVWDKQILLQYAGIGKHGRLLHYSGLLLPCAEIGAALALFVYKSKKWPLLILIFMHTCILIVLGPLGLNSNHIVWPWNLWLIVILYLLKYCSIYETNVFKILPKKTVIILSVFWLLLPASNLFGYWIHYFSSGMYTGKTPHVYICVDKTETAKVLLPYFSNDKHYQHCAGRKQVRINRWAEKETGCMPFTELFYYKRLKERISKNYPDWKFEMFYGIYPYKGIKEIK